MTDISKHVALRKLYEASLSLERLPASPEQTATAILISDAHQSVDALVNEVNRIQNVAIMSDFTFMAAQELREAVEPFRCDTFGCETPQSERLDKACAALDRVRGNGLLKAAKDAEISRLRAELERVRGQRDRWILGFFKMTILPNSSHSAMLHECGLRILDNNGVRTVEEIEK